MPSGSFNKRKPRSTSRQMSKRGFSDAKSPCMIRQHSLVAAFARTRGFRSASPHSGECGYSRIAGGLLVRFWPKRASGLNGKGVLRLQRRNKLKENRRLHRQHRIKIVVLVIKGPEQSVG